MATMIPEKIESPNVPESEKKVFEKLSKLDDNYTVIHSYLFTQGKLTESDFIIIHKYYGFINMEVKGGGISQHKGVWYSTDRGGNQNKIKDPFKQASNAMYRLKDIYSKKYNDNFRGVFDYMVCFPNCKYDTDHVIDISKLDNLNSILPKIFKHTIESYNVKPDTKSISQFTSLIAGDITLDWAIASVIESQEKKLEDINRFQDYLLDLFDDKKRIGFKGAAGSGKTFIAIKKAIRLANEDKKVLFLVFNKHISDFIAKQLDNKNIMVNTFHSFALEEIFAIIEKERENTEISKLFDEFLVKLYGNEDYVKDLDMKGFIHTFDKISGNYTALLDEYTPKLGLLGEIVNILITKDRDELYKINIPLALQEIFEQDKHQTTHFDALLIDEGQDFSKEWCECIRPVFRSEEDRIVYIFYDDNQNIFRDEKTLPVSDLISEHNLTSHVFNLNTNLRNTRNIHDYALKHTGKSDIAKSFEIEGLDPVEFKMKDEKEAIKKITTLLTELTDKHAVSREDIIILSDNNIENSIFKGDTNALSPFKLIKSGEGKSKKTIRFRTISKFKGLEAPVVILIISNKQTFNNHDLLYVGMTRARHMLYVFSLK